MPPTNGLTQQQHNHNNNNNNTNNMSKQSGSIECVSPTGLAPNLATALSSSEATSLGTWKLIKGKVSQTIEDIKSSKSSGPNLSNTSLSKAELTHHQTPQQLQQESQQQQYQPQQQQHLEVESDQENADAHSSISEDFSLGSEHRSSHHKADSDSSLDSELLLESDVEHSRLRRGLAHLKSKVKAKSAAHHQRHQQRHQHQPHQHQPISLATAALSSATISTAFGTASIKAMPKKEKLPTTASSTGDKTSSSITVSGSTTGPRRRRSESRKSDIVIPKLADNDSLPSINVLGDKKRRLTTFVSGKKDVEIESGVEMMEDMIPPTPVIELLDSVPSTSKSSRKTSPKRAGDTRRVQVHTTKPVTISYYKSDIPADSTDSIKGSTPVKVAPSKFNFSWALSKVRGLPLLPFAGLVTVLLLPIPDFVRGVLSCLMSFVLVDSLAPLLTRLIEYHMVLSPPEKTKFEIPDYSKMPICEIPAVEEHKTVKTYAGWMNEVFSYDPNNSHISLSSSVYVRLTGTALRVSSTMARVPKRAMWNEVPIDMTTVVFNEHRTYNLLGCRVELLPVGMAKKRYFNRKYPIQLIIKNCAEPRFELPSGQTSQRPSTTSSKEELLDIHYGESIQQMAASSGEERAKLLLNEGDRDVDLASTILNADLQSLQNKVNPNADQDENTIPCGDEVRLLLFSRGDREKEDWYRRFVAASHGDIYDQDLHLPNIKLINDADLQKATSKTSLFLDVTGKEPAVTASTPSVLTNVPPLVIEGKTSEDEKSFKDINDDMEVVDMPDETYEGLLMSSCAARNPEGYVRFMAKYQKACRQDKIPVFTKKGTILDETQTKSRKQRREKRIEEELWRGIDQSLYLGPSGSVVWANVLVGRILYSCLHDNVLHGKIQDFLQKKLSSIKLPSFMEDVVIKQIDFGNTPPLVHRVSQPLLDERGTWVDADVTYEGHLYIIVTTKLNLLRLKRPITSQARQPMTLGITVPSAVSENASVQPPQFPQIILAQNPSTNLSTNSPRLSVLSGTPRVSTISGIQVADQQEYDDQYANAIFDSDAESSGGSSSEDSTGTTAGAGAGGVVNDPSSMNELQAQGNARRIFKIVDRIAASNFFQYAAELPYVQRAMENMSASITLRVDLKGLVARGTLNIPPPPSDRIWLAFRGPPRLWISAKPTVGDKSVDWSIVTNIIESKLCEEVNKYLVYPNMVDVSLPFLGHPTYYKDT